MKLHPLRYWLRQSLQGMRRSWTIQLAAVGSVAVGLFLVGLLALGAVNLHRLTHVQGALHITAYLHPDAPRKRTEKLRKALAHHPLVAEVRRVSPEEAHRRLHETLGSRHGLLSGVEPGFLPASLELSLREGTADQVRPLLGLLGASPVVEEVDYLGPWIKRLTAFVSLVQGIGIIVAIVLCLACLYIVGTTIRLGVFSRKEEISILRLVGATDRYIRAPFMLEGAFQGLTGALLASGLLYLLFHLGSPVLEELIADALSQTRLGFLTTGQLLLGIAAGTLLGLAGSRAALARHVDP